MDLTTYLISTCPSTAAYIPNFITIAEEQLIFSHVERTPKPKWTQLSNRRLINYGGTPHSKGMLAELMPEWLQTFVDRVNSLGVFNSQKANHVLVNEYKSGQGIMPHRDGPLFLPIITTISLGSHIVLEFSKCHDNTNQNISTETTAPTTSLHAYKSGIYDKSKDYFKLILEPRSLLILKDNLYSDYLHSISNIKADVLCEQICNFKNCELAYKLGDRLQRGTRISLTIRCVPKTSRIKLSF